MTNNFVPWCVTRDSILDDLRNISCGYRKYRYLLTICFNLEFQVILIYRLTHFLSGRHSTGIILLPLLYLQQVITGCYINPAAEIGFKIRLPHPTGIVIGKDARIGNSVTLYQHVTIGSDGKPGRQRAYPTIADEVTLYAGATVVGAVTVNRAAIIGAGAVVLDDIPPNAVAVGVPARITCLRGTFESYEPVAMPASQYDEPTIS